MAFCAWPRRARSSATPARMARASSSRPTSNISRARCSLTRGLHSESPKWALSAAAARSGSAVPGSSARTALSSGLCVRRTQASSSRVRAEGRRDTSVSRAPRSISSTSQGVVAATVAVRGRSASTATSPKKSPASMRRISKGWFCPAVTKTWTLPLTMRKMLAPGSPSRTIRSPGE